MPEMGSYEWSLVGYGFIALLILFCIWVVTMMFLATKKEKSQSRALPALTPEVMKKEAEGSFFISSMEDSVPQKRNTKIKRPVRKVLSGKPGEAGAPSAGSSSLPEAKPIFKQDNFTLSDGSDRG